MKLFKIIDEHNKVVATVTAESFELEKGKNFFGIFGPDKKPIGTICLSPGLRFLTTGEISGGK